MLFLPRRGGEKLAFDGELVEVRLAEDARLLYFEHSATQQQFLLVGFELLMSD